MNAPDSPELTPAPETAVPAPERSLPARLRRFVPYFHDVRWVLPVIFLAILTGAATEPAIPALMQPLLDQGFQAGALDLWLVPAAIMGLFAVRGAAGFVAYYGLAYMANHAMRSLRERLFARVLDADLTLFSQQSNGASGLANTIVYEVQTGTTLLVNALLSLVKDSLTLIALMGYLLYINWRLTLFVLVIFPAVAWVMKVLSRRLHRITRASQTATDALAYVVEENVLAHRVVRLHQAQAQQAARFDAHNRELRTLALKGTVAASAMTPLTQMVAAAALSAVICTALWQSVSAGTTVGTFAAFITAMLMLVAPIKHLSESASPITRGLAAVERGLDLIEHAPTERGGAHTQVRARGEIRFEQVSLRFPGKDDLALDALDLHVAPGQTVALVGSSGAGKTTLVNLLPRFLEPTGGRVSLDGVPLQDWDLNALRRQFAFVSQDVTMFNASVAQNVALGDAPDRERVRAALVAANLAGFVEGLPLGMDTPVGHNAVEFSGGQRQRLAIARALYKDAPVLVLDEATSALDTESERLVQEALRTLMTGRTTLIIAHRLSTVEHADRTVVMEAGRIVESGTHDSLLRAGGAYAHLHSLSRGGQWVD